ncbi:MAG TPA: TldD/PmbA family protein [Candidatus Limnocylindrales bacterium]|nr:TldD/PmbA family protein [Candidatus Limnocylindrales bacterium]
MVATSAGIDELLDRALGASTAEQTEALYLAQDAALTRFATNRIHQSVREHDATLQVRVIDGDRIGVASTNRLDDGGIRDVVERAMAIAERSAPNPRAAVMPEPDGREHDPELGYVATTGDASAERRAEGARAVIAAGEAKGLQSAGSFSTSVMTLAVANSHGIRARHRNTRASLLTVMMDGFGSGAASGYAHAGSTDVGEIDAEALGTEAAEKGDAMRGAGELEAGEYEVILEEYAVGGLLEYLSYIGFSGLAHEEGRSFMELGQQLMGKDVSIWDDGADPTGIPSVIDFEGVARKRVALIETGVAQAVVHDAATGARAGTGSTGHALPAPNLIGPLPLNLFMAPGSTPRDQLIAGVKRGVWVTRFHYINPVHPKKAILTGMTKDGTFLIENGRLSRPVMNFRFTQAIPEAFSDVRAMSSGTKLLPGEFAGSNRVPAMHLGAFNFTGVTASEGGE